MCASPCFSRGTAGYWRLVRRATVTAVPGEGSRWPGAQTLLGWDLRTVVDPLLARACEDRIFRILGCESGLIRNHRVLHFFSFSLVCGSFLFIEIINGRRRGVLKCLVGMERLVHPKLPP